jgi:glycosyltransferase involved in cell wall biosynthesis
MFDVAYHTLAGDRPDVVVASGPPFHAFVAGYFIKRWTLAKLVLDYRDEWTQCPFDFVEKGGSNERWERRCLGAADSVILTTVSQRDRLNSVYGEVAEKSSVIPNGWEPEDFAVADLEPAKHPSRPVTLLFAGKLGGHTDPDPFLRTRRKLFDHKPEWLGAVKVRFVGQKTDVALEALRAFPFQQAIDIVDSVPKREVASCMRRCDALLLLHDRRYARYLPGKLYDYLASDKPILVVDDRGETRRLIETLQAGWVIDSSDVQALNEVITMLLDRPSPANPARLRWMARHTREKLAGQFLDRIANS